MAQKVTVVIPVYADWSSLKDCIGSLKEHLDAAHQVILVNDSGPEADELEREIKQTITGSTNFHYYRNTKNLGFLQTCNRAVLELDKTGNDILLLNSDTEVTKGFLEEMLSVLHSKKSIAAVSPRTNNATIFTLPLAAIGQKGIKPEKSYELFKKYKKRFDRYNQVPTAHGFCMLIKREVIKKHGLFDEAFGMGYGEEVDFCQRILKSGWLSVISNWSYVFHLEARSFTPQRKRELLEQSNKIIRQRYPDYQQSVRTYISNALDIEREILPAQATKQKSGHFVRRLVGQLYRYKTKS